MPEIARTLEKSPALVLTAEPGAGKTTRVPATLLDAGFARNGQILVSEPRRLPARLAATFVAKERGQAVGREVGYSVRFEHVGTDATRLVYATEGVLLRRLLENPTLSDVGAVVLDEVHERHLTTDLLLALLVRLQRGPRPDLRLIAMSATIDAEALAAHLGAPHLRSEGRAFPLSIEHEPRADDRPLEGRVASAVRRLLKEEPSGDVLVFLPGAREIRLCLRALEREAASGAVLVLPLHGDLSIAEQARAVEPSSSRRVILSTNVAESSVTIEGVTAVVDSGLVRLAGHSPWSGLPTLTTAKISRASATQRAGRAGRTAPGRVLRLYTAGELATRPEHDKPEILREDLAEAWLSLRGAGVLDPGELAFLDAPPPAALAAAETLLARLGATGKDGALTAIGRRMLELPLPPRLARVVVEGEARGVASETSLASAILSERDIREGARTQVGGRGGSRGGPRADDLGGPSDVLEVMDRFDEARDARFDARRLNQMGLDHRAVTAVDRAAKQIAASTRRRGTRPEGAEAVDRAVQIALLTGFPDRIARRRNRTDRALTLFSGKSARLSDSSVVHDAQLLIALDAEDGGREIVVRSASSIEPDWLLELFPDMVEMTDELLFNGASKQVELVSKIAFGSVLLDEERRPAPPSPEASALLLKAARAAGQLGLDRDGRARDVRVRLSLLAAHCPEAGVPNLGDGDQDVALARACEGRTKLSELEGVDLAEALLDALPPSTRALLEREAPSRLTLPGGRTIDVHYENGKPPWVESRLQDFFGMTRTPTVLRGRVPLTVHLLAPNQRAVQVTNDLAGFWERHYPATRRELSRRYPRHFWPEDGGTAAPPPPLPPRRPRA